MPNSTAICDDDPQNEALMLDSYAESPLATIEMPVDYPPSPLAATGPCCVKCNAPIQSEAVAICRRCGWYGSLGTFVELDPNWEPDLEPANPTSGAPQPSLQGWLKLVPRWAWLIIASVGAVIAESVVARLVTPSGSSLRTIWSLSQLTLGFFAVVGCHIFNFLVLAADDAEIGLLDLLLKPLKLWVRAGHNLPARLWVANSAASGLTAALMSVVVIGGLPYDRLWDWGFKEPPKQNLMGAVMNRMKQLDSADENKDLEGAISDFAGSQDVGGSETPQQKPEKPRDKVDCVILGYCLSQNGEISSLLLGAPNRGRLGYAGQVTPKLSDGDMQDLLQMLEAIPAQQSFIAVVGIDAIWVQPKYACRVSFAGREKNGRLSELEWERMLGSMKTR
jgi:hypothetical protein